MYKDKWKNYYFESKHIDIPNKWILLRSIGKSTISDKTQEKLERIIFYHTIGKRNALYTSSYFGINPKTLHKWLKRFDEKNLYSLEEYSRKPKRTRGWMVTPEEESNIISLRRNNMEYGKKKLQVLYRRDYGRYIST